MELLVVVAVAALLAGIALPSLQSARRLAKPERCKWNQAKVAEAIFLYAEDFDDAIPYSLYKEPGPYNIPFWWHVVVGRIPPEYIDKDWENWPNEWFPGVQDHNSVEYRICAEGYVDYPSWGDNEVVPYKGAFVCPAFVDQVEPKSTWPGATSCHFSINGNVSRSYSEVSPFPRPPEVTLLSDVRPKAVLIGDGNLNPGGNIRVDYIYRTQWMTGRLYVLNLRPGSIGRYDFGPWTHQRHIGKWSLSMPCDFYGHPGEKCNLALADGHVQPVHDLDGNAWIIEPLDKEEDGNEQGGQ